MEEMNSRIRNMKGMSFHLPFTPLCLHYFDCYRLFVCDYDNTVTTPVTSQSQSQDSQLESAANTLDNRICLLVHIHPPLLADTQRLFNFNLCHQKTAFMFELLYYCILLHTYQSNPNCRRVSIKDYDCDTHFFSTEKNGFIQVS